MNRQIFCFFLTTSNIHRKNNNIEKKMKENNKQLKLILLGIFFCWEDNFLKKKKMKIVQLISIHFITPSNSFFLFSIFFFFTPKLYKNFFFIVRCWRERKKHVCQTNQTEFPKWIQSYWKIEFQDNNLR